MGGLGSHHTHPYALQALAFVGSLLLPGVLFALLGGAWWEQLRRRRPWVPEGTAE
ncbi:MAG TPA: hypothetical protein VMF11_10530 [Candidatus Baltobacteraceae bacterium]|nr:hypothetical protein [Candidatus Baltobacteraceae bacterium]